MLNGSLRHIHLTMKKIVPEYEPAKLPNKGGLNLDEIDSIFKKNLRNI